LSWFSPGRDRLGLGHAFKSVLVTFWSLGPRRCGHHACGRRLGAVHGRLRPLLAGQRVGRCRVPSRCRGASLASSCSLLDKTHRAAVVRLGKNRGSGWLRSAIVARISSPDSATVLNSPACPFTCRGEVEDPGHSRDGISLCIGGSR
jgi:hypothetical protein